MDFKANIGFHNRFDIEVRDKDTGELKQRGQAENIVLNRAYTRLCNYDTYFVNIFFGSGTGTLDPTRTTLFSSLGYKAAVTEEIIKAYPVSKWTRKITLNPEEYVGANITEVGISDTTNAINTHALITDAEGNPLSINKTDIDVVVIYATVFIELQNKSGNIIFHNLPTSNILLNYLCGSSTAIEPSIKFGGIALNYPTGDINSYLGAITPTKTVDATNKKVTYTGRAGITTANAYKRIQSISLSNIFRCSLPEIGVWDRFQLENVSVGTGDGETTSFSIPHTDIEDVIVKVDGAVSPVEDYSLNDIPFRDGNNAPLSCYLPLGEDPIDSDTYTGPFNGETYSRGYNSDPKTVIFNVDGEKLLNRSLVYSIRGATDAYGTSYAYIDIYTSTDNITYTKRHTKYAGSTTVTDSYTFTGVYNYIKISVYQQNSTKTVYFYYALVSPGAAPSITFNTPPGLVTAEAVGIGDGLADTFSLSRTPALGLTVYINGVATTEYTITGADITFTTAPSSGDVITADYRYTCAITMDYKVPYIPKSEDYVLDVTMELQFGEGV